MSFPVASVARMTAPLPRLPPYLTPPSPESLNAPEGMAGKELAPLLKGRGKSILTCTSLCSDSCHPTSQSVIKAHWDQRTWGLVTLWSLISSRTSHLSSLRPHFLQGNETCPGGLEGPLSAP